MLTQTDHNKINELSREINELSNQKKYKEALNVALNLQDKYPKYVHVYDSIAYIYNQLQEKNKAKECIKEQIKVLEELVKKPEEAGYQHNTNLSSLARAYERLEQYEKANTVLDEYLKLATSESEQFSIKSRLASNYVKLEKIDKAAELYKDLVEDSPIAHGHYAMTNILKSSMDKAEILELHEKMVSAFKAEIKKFPANAANKQALQSYLYDIAHFYKEEDLINDYIESVAKYSNLAEFDSNLSFRVKSIADTFGMPDKALEALSKFEEANPDNPLMLKTKTELIEKLSPEEAAKQREELANKFADTILNQIKNDKYDELKEIQLYQIENMAPDVVADYLNYMLDKSPDSIRNLRFGVTHKDKYPVEKILKAYDYVLKNDKNAAYIRKDKANFLSVIGRYEDAAKEYVKSIESEAEYYLYSNIIHNYRKAENEEMVKKYSEKYIKILTELIDKNEDNEEYLRSLATLYSDLGDDENYVSVYKQVVERNPTKYYYFSSLATSYERLEKFDEALAVYQDFIDQNEVDGQVKDDVKEGLAWIYSYKANLHTQRGDYDLAIKAVERANELCHKDVFDAQLSKLSRLANK
ncbi:tetratricopeptide repeat protein [Candidatus Dojkabacteria bacterium]|nr:tetratricopeptide repeat protein [Candidatus Dojkabacteria bacterium]